MRKILRTTIMLLIPGTFLASCGSMQQTTQVRDDVYFMPSSAPPPAATASRQAPAGDEQIPMDDYYDPGTSSQFNDHRNYYDMAYNDPYYYNYGRFGFNAGMGMGMGMGMMGWQSGWGGPGWGMGMGWGMGPSMGMGWGMGGMGMGMGGMGMGWGNPWSPWHQPWGWNSPWGWNRPMGFSPWGWNDPFYGYGYGNYHGPYGNCFSCYSPVVIGASNTVVGHRPSLTGGSAGNTGQGGADLRPRMNVRNPVGLNRAQDSAPSRSGTPSRTRPGTIDRPTQSLDRGTQQRGLDRGRTPAQQRPDRQVSPRQSQPSRNIDRGGSIDRGGGGSFDRGGGSMGGGSRSTGGGGRPR
jgi:hypothetical protein